MKETNRSGYEIRLDVLKLAEGIEGLIMDIKWGNGAFMKSLKDAHKLGDLLNSIGDKFNLKIIELASKNATAVALQGKAVDIIVTDWFWVSRQRSENRLFSFVPHSMAAGGLIVSKQSKINTDKDLENKKNNISQYLSDSIIILPVNHDLSIKDIDRVIEVINE